MRSKPLWRENVWSLEMVEKAQVEDPDLGPVVDQLLRKWRKTTTEELQPYSRAKREVQAQFELLEL